MTLENKLEFGFCIIFREKRNVTNISMLSNFVPM